jgi:hypothetical protein
MQEAFVIRVDSQFMCDSQAGKLGLLTYSIQNAKRYRKEIAFFVAGLAATVFPKSRIFVAHARCPDKEFDTENPPEKKRGHSTLR